MTEINGIKKINVLKERLTRLNSYRGVEVSYAEALNYYLETLQNPSLVYRPGELSPNLSTSQNESLVKLAQFLDFTLNNYQWQQVEKRLSTVDTFSTVISNELEEQQLKDEIDKPTLNQDLVRIYDAFSLASQISYLKHSWDIPLDTSDAEDNLEVANLFQDIRIAKAAKNAAWEMIYREQLVKEGYLFPNIEIIAGQDYFYNNMTGISRPAHHPAEIAERKKVSRRRFLGMAAWASTAVAGGAVGVTGFNHLREVDASLETQKNDERILIAYAEMKVKYTRIEEIDQILTITPDRAKRTLLQEEKNKLAQQIDEIKEYVANYKNEEYGNPGFKASGGLLTLVLGAVALSVGSTKFIIKLKNRPEYAPLSE